MRRRLGNERGALLFSLLLAVTLIGLMLGMTGQAWSDALRREREDELFFRGDQYRRAIQSYYEKTAGGVGRYPKELKLLVEDDRFPKKVRHIRKLWSDPVAGGEWEIIAIDPQQGGGIKGVRSRSRAKPFRQDGFPEEYAKFVGATSYNQWEFVFEPEQKDSEKKKQ